MTSSGPVDRSSNDDGSTTGTGPRRRDETPTGSPTLAGLRALLGLSQQALAARSGVAIRTVRSLERGGASTPRRATIDRVLRVLQPDNQARSAILGELGFEFPWRPETPGELFVATSLVDLAAYVEPVIRRYTVVTTDRTSVVRDRQVVSDYYRAVISASEPNVTRVSGVVFSDGPDDPTIVAREGCEIERWHRIGGTGLILVECTLSRPLGIGEAHAYAAEVTHAPTARAATSADDNPDGGHSLRPDRGHSLRPDRGHSLRPDRGHSLIGFYQGAQVGSVRVRFDLADLPQHCDATYADRVDGTFAAQRRIPVEPDGAATLVLTDPRPGWHGVAWSW